MKFSTIMIVTAVVCAMATTGCKYNKGARGVKGGAYALGSDISSSEITEGDIDLAGERRFEDYCTRCTDVEFAPVYFSFDSTVVPNAELGKIEDVAKYLQSNSGRVVVIEGNCDERGSNEYNLALGENRAIIIRNYLVQNEIAASRIQTRSYGEEKPAVNGHNEAAWSKNRRCEFSIYKK